VTAWEQGAPATSVAGMAGPGDFETWLADWRPPAVVAEDSMAPGPAAALAAALDEPPSTSPWLTPLRHWVHFLEWPPTDVLGPDGHPLDGPLMPPIPDRTRMFVGGRLQVLAGLRTGVPACRHSTVLDQQIKSGRSGTMLLLTVRHEIEQDGHIAIVDEQDLMYRSGPTARAAAASSPDGSPTSDAPWQEVFTAVPIVLFRFSALTANSHRIHYDRPYATEVEGYGDLVVHGPLLAILLARLAERIAPERSITSLSYRFARPVLAGQAILLTGRPAGDGAELAVVAADGQPSATATVTYA
jgi:hydroxyacyl-ACP dehydratase HTD2-like protein with hotdog domain